MFIFSLGIFILLFVPEKLKTRDRSKDDLIIKSRIGTRSSMEAQSHYGAVPRHSRSDIYIPRTSDNSGFLEVNHQSPVKSIKSSTQSQTTAVSGLSYQEVLDNPPNLGEGHDWSDLFSSYKKLLSNRVFLGVVGASAADMAFVSVISMYGLIYLSEIYNIPQDVSSLIFRYEISPSEPNSISA